MKVEIWSDVVCPFCYIGKRKFEKALEGFAAKDKVEIVWRSFQLDPDMKHVEGQSVHEYLGRRKGGTTEDGKRMNDYMAGIAKEVGLQYDFDNAIISNTMNAHKLLHYAKEQGVQNELKERLFKAYYTEGKNIGDIPTLLSLAEEVGLNALEATKAFEKVEYEKAVHNDQEEAYQVGVQGVPFFVFNNKYAVSGAQQPETFAQVLDKVWAEEKPALIVNEGEGFCDINGNCN